MKDTLGHSQHLDWIAGCKVLCCIQVQSHLEAFAVEMRWRCPNQTYV